MVLMSWTLVLILSVFCGLCGAGTEATCSSEDPDLRSTPNWGTGRTLQQCEYNDHGVHSFYELVMFEIQDFEGAVVLANITVYCFDESGDLVFNESDNTLDSNQNQLFYLNHDLPRIHNKTLRCNYTGCYHQANSDMYYLLNITDECYLDFNECQSDDFNDCDKNATCTNNEKGTYNCTCHEGFVENGSYCEKEVFPLLDNISESLIVRDGTNATLHCTGSSESGHVSVTWSTSIPGLDLPQPIVVQDGNTTTSSITLESLNDSYSGNYFCNVSNKFGEKIGNTSVLVIIISSPETIVVTTGNTVDLTCNASGSPDLRYKWLFSESNAHRLTIQDVGIEHERNYSCNVSVNDIVVGQCKILLLTQGPEIIEHPANVTTTAVSDFMFILNCTATNNVDARNYLTFYWIKNGKLLENYANHTTIVLDSNTVTSQLTMAYAVAAPGTDSYHCIATNREIQDGANSSQAFVTIYPPSIIVPLTRGLVTTGALLLAIVASSILMVKAFHCYKIKLTEARMKMIHRGEYFVDNYKKSVVDVTITAMHPTEVIPDEMSIYDGILYPEQQMIMADQEASNSSAVTEVMRPLHDNIFQDGRDSFRGSTTIKSTSLQDVAHSQSSHHSIASEGCVETVISQDDLQRSCSDESALGTNNIEPCAIGTIASGGLVQSLNTSLEGITTTEGVTASGQFAEICSEKYVIADYIGHSTHNRSLPEEDLNLDDSSLVSDEYILSSRPFMDNTNFSTNPDSSFGATIELGDSINK